jgi:hypothetical protein
MVSTHRSESEMARPITAGGAHRTGLMEGWKSIVVLSERTSIQKLSFGSSGSTKSSDRRYRRSNVKRVSVALLAAILSAAPGSAETITIEAVGTVVTNVIYADEPLSLVNPGDTVTMTLNVDPKTWDSFYPDFYRAYGISSFNLAFSGGEQIKLLPGETSYFSVADDFYFGQDSFWVSNYFYVEPGKVQLEQPPYLFDFQVSYEGATLDSVDILDALGAYDSDTAVLFGFRVWDSYANDPSNLVMIFEFEQLTILDGSIFSDGFETGGTSEWTATSQ